MTGKNRGVQAGFVFALFSLLLGSSAAGAVDIGGAVETSLVGTVTGAGKIEPRLENKINLQFHLPREARTNARLEVELQQGEKVTGALVKSLYIRQRFDRAHLTVGRQPVSWSFGALFNPVDFNPGAEALEEETAGKFVDAVEVYIPVAWNAGISLLSAFPSTADDPKWGARVRGGFGGYDLAVNYVWEPAQKITWPGLGEISFPTEQRLGFTVKGDLGPVGVYGALGFTRPEGGKASRSLLAGVDYSRVLRYIHPLSVQVEYVGLEAGTPLFPGRLGIPVISTNPVDENINLAAGRVSYGIDDFTTIGLLAVTGLDDQSLVLMPSCETYLGSNVMLTVRGGIYRGEEGTLFGPPPGTGRKAVRGAFAVSLQYPF